MNTIKHFYSIPQLKKCHLVLENTVYLVNFVIVKVVRLQINLN